MTGFTPSQLNALTAKLDRVHVRNRESGGKTLDYIEGWFAIAEANAIFGFAGWDREMVHFERLFERSREEGAACGYVARVRLRVRAGKIAVIREGTGFGQARAKTLGEAHERALKAAETDATKRALSTFGNRFGLGLYDKEQNGVTPPKAEARAASDAGASDTTVPSTLPTAARTAASATLDVDQASPQTVIATNPLRSANGADAANLDKNAAVRRAAPSDGLTMAENGAGRPMAAGPAKPSLDPTSSKAFRLMDENGNCLADHLSPEGFCSALRQVIAILTPHDIPALAKANEPMLHHLGEAHPELISAKGEPFADILRKLMRRKMAMNEDLAGAQPSPTFTTENPIPANSGQAGSGHAVAADRRAAVAGPGPQEAPDGEPGPASQGPKLARSVTVPGLDSGLTGEVPRPDTIDTGAASPAQTAQGACESRTQRPADPGSNGKNLPLAPSKIAPGPRIDKSTLAIGSERRLRDKAHLKRIQQLPCIVCGRRPSQSHHVKFAQARGLSLKVSDEYVVPLCVLHHSELHRASDERKWWKMKAISPLPIAAKLWAERGNGLA